MEDNCFTKWVPHDNVDSVYDIEDIGWHSYGFALLLRPDNFDYDKRSGDNLEMVWSDVLCYQVTQESYRPEWWIDNPDDAWTFYTSQSSGFLKNFQKNNILVPENIYHFIIAGTNTFVDIISTEYPKIIFKK